MTYRYVCGECGLDESLTLEEISEHHIECFSEREEEQAS